MTVIVIAAPIVDGFGDDVTVIVTGGAGKHSCWQPTFGDQTWPARRAIGSRAGSRAPVDGVKSMKAHPAVNAAYAASELAGSTGPGS